MKHMWKDGEYELVMADNDNYDLNRCYKSTSKDGVQSDATANIGHFNKLQSAVKRVCELRANDRCEDLKSWLVEYKASQAYFAEMFGN